MVNVDYRGVARVDRTGSTHEVARHNYCHYSEIAELAVLPDPERVGHGRRRCGEEVVEPIIAGPAIKVKSDCERGSVHQQQQLAERVEMLPTTV